MESLGANLAVESKRTQPGINLSLGPLVVPHARKHMPQVLPPMQEDLADDRMEPRYVDGGPSLGIRPDQTTADSTLGRGQKTEGGRTRMIEHSARAWIRTESAP